MMLTLKPSMAKGTIRETVTLISDQIPYRLAPSPLVKMGILRRLKNRVTILAAITKPTCLPKEAYS